MPSRTGRRTTVVDHNRFPAITPPSDLCLAQWRKPRYRIANPVQPRVTESGD